MNIDSRLIYSSALVLIMTGMTFVMMKAGDPHADATQMVLFLLVMAALFGACAFFIFYCR